MIMLFDLVLCIRFTLEFRLVLDCILICCFLFILLVRGSVFMLMEVKLLVVISRLWYLDFFFIIKVYYECLIFSNLVLVY